MSATPVLASAAPGVASGARGLVRAALTPPVSLARHHWRLLGVLGAAHLFHNYNLAILGLALPQIQAGLGVSDTGLGSVVALVQLGVIPALLLTVLADRIGRRRLLVVTITGFTLCTVLSAFARDAREFVVLQFFARMFIAGEWMLAIVVVAEELAADARGWGVGVLGALGTLGHGVAAVVFAAVSVLPFGWRALYVLGALPILLLAWFRRNLGETHRFAVHQRLRPRETMIRATLQPLRDLLVMYPGRLLALAAAVFPTALVFETALLFTSKFLQESRGYSPGDVATMYLTAGVLTPLANVAAGSLGDRFGRKLVMVVGLLANGIAVALFYNVTGVWIPLAWGLMVCALSTVQVLFAAVGSEVFPTSYRSTASAARAIVMTLGFACGLWLEGVLFTLTGSHAAAMTALLLVAPVAPLVVALALPETAARELEDIAPERRVA